MLGNMFLIERAKVHNSDFIIYWIRARLRYKR
jgi:hypothetical protein